MLDKERIVEFAKEIPGNTLYLWVTGPSGCGKTTLIENLREELEGERGVFSDGAYILEEVVKDKEQQYHIKQPDGRFLITDTSIHDRVHHRLVADLQNFQGDICLIELARGEDIQGIIDLSYRRLIDNIPVKILENSLFVYIRCPFSERMRRNEIRDGQSADGNYRKVNPIAMERFFQTDDFEQWRQTMDLPTIVIDNF